MWLRAIGCLGLLTLTLGAGGPASAQTPCPLNAPTAALSVIGVAGDWIPPPAVMAAVQRAEGVLHGQISQKYLLMPRIQVVARLGANTLSVFAAVPPGLTLHKGDTVTVLMRHRDPDTACSYVPYLVTRVENGEL